MMFSQHLRTTASGSNFAPHHRTMKTSATTHDHAIEITRQVTIKRPAAEVYRFWRDAANLQRISDARVSIAPTSATRSHWAVRVPGRRIEWDADITHDTPDREIAWQASAEADIPNSGSVRFEPLGADETAVTLALTFHPPAGVLGSLVGNAAKQRIAHEVDHALDRTKSQLEKPAGL
jgi:uncharacterized membrane protein